MDYVLELTNPKPGQSFRYTFPARGDLHAYVVAHREWSKSRLAGLYTLSHVEGNTSTEIFRFVRRARRAEPPVVSLDDFRSPKY